MTRILLVEDDCMNCDMLSRRLAWEGFDVLVASDGAQAVALALAEQPDLILMDMGLPVLDGWQATQRIKAELGSRSIPVIALTAYVMNEDRSKAMAVGCDDFEVKPVEFPRLIAKMRALIGAVSSGPAPG